LQNKLLWTAEIYKRITECIKTVFFINYYSGEENEDNEKNETDYVSEAGVDRMSGAGDDNE
jgi:hypothetical protein